MGGKKFDEEKQGFLFLPTFLCRIYSQLFRLFPCSQHLPLGLQGYMPTGIILRSLLTINSDHFG